MIVKIYANYGVLAHEKQTAYTVVPHEHATVSEPVLVDLPASVNPRENAGGEILVDLDGTTYLLSEVIGGDKDGIALKWFDGKTHRHIPIQRKS